ncbi:MULTISPECIES: DUF1810 domain-containing protein [Bacillota]|uniref:DUF1810 domain-containing protein n=2 Tax=Amedibacillus TaxID=2749846 RepID=A0A7G9GK46_9FIRM|nr:MULTISPECIES: DUF1810 domain-containing protein [Bacillota]QNM11178.1 DUF1810 domain-containing protein [[Eubacterium] hominis]MCH4284771.1 DUF1810 domain-containing protein [Amedibacillus hominis]RGB52604.1 DUF1810 domain-containing protein [Absiella sp. AM22-9]RGB57077.1 DUF1810 domain-containing protein [Absiella sp. AM10-20]RGB68072.1 DUF1810 domain-containing protein [Absiella sp. AM09-45]
MSNLDRFIKAQENDYETALNEIENGHKQSHWIWYIFPQLQGLGFSSMSQFYGIKDEEEAIDYMNHPVLRERLLEISQALLSLDCNDPVRVMGYPDNLKLQSSMTLFSIVSKEPVFQKVLDKFYDGQEDQSTLEKLKK